MGLSAIQLIILDVDGVLTDGGLIFDDQAGAALKVFNTHDGRAIKQWQQVGQAAAILSGRYSEAVTKRAGELQIDCVHQGIRQKLPAYEGILAEFGMTDDEVAYLGDDLPDLPPMMRCGLPAAVANAVPEVKRAACYVTRRPGGQGAVAELIEWLLRKQGKWAATRSGVA